jgi:hypothetical protein
VMPVLSPLDHLALSLSALAREGITPPSFHVFGSAASVLCMLTLGYVSYNIVLTFIATKNRCSKTYSSSFRNHPSTHTPELQTEALRRHVNIDKLCPVTSHTPREELHTRHEASVLPPPVGTPCELCSVFCATELIKHGHLKRRLPCLCEFHAICIDMFFMAESSDGDFVHDFYCPTCSASVLRTAQEVGKRAAGGEFAQVTCQSRSRIQVV